MTWQSYKILVPISLNNNLMVLKSWLQNEYKPWYQKLKGKDDQTKVENRIENCKTWKVKVRTSYVNINSAKFNLPICYLWYNLLMETLILIYL